MLSRWFLSLCLLASAVIQVCAQTPTKPNETPDAAKEGFVFERIDNRVRFESDGTGIRDTTAVIRVQSQAGVQEFGQLILGYSSATEKLEVSYVRVRKPDGRVIETPPANAQDLTPEILQQAPMYSDYRQRHISVVGLQAGDVMEYRTIVHVIQSLVPGQFWYEYSFPKGVFVTEDRLEVDVPKSHQLKLKSPDRKYEAHETGDRRIYTWVVQNIAPKRTKDSGEEEEGPSNLGPDVQISTFADWQQVAKWYAKLEGDQAVPDDTLRKKAAELTRGATTTTEKVQRLYNFVALNIRYVSLSFGVGRYEPHAAGDVLQNGYGDCKDKHTLLAALLGAEGISSYPVLIDSSRKLDPDIPSPAQFDHVISAVRVGANLVWLDTTAEVAPYGLILYQLRNKQAVLASNDAEGGLRRTPADSPVKNLATVSVEGKFSELGTLDANIDVTAQGDSDVLFRGAFRELPPARWDDLLKYFSAAWGLDGEVSQVHVGPLEDTSKPFHVTYHYHKDEYFAVPNPDARFFAVPPMVLPRLQGKKNSSDPLDVGPAVERDYRARLEFPANYSIHIPPDVKMTRDYGEYSATYTLAKNVLQGERRMVLRVNELPASRRSDFESFRNVAGDTVQQVLSAVITRPSGAEAASVAKTSGSPEELRKAATTAMHRDDFSTAVDLLKRVVELDPKAQDAWDELGLAYAGLNNHEDAIRAFRKQIEVDAFHARANDDLGAELRQIGRLDEAIAAYRKQIEIAPTDRLAHKNLGLILAQLKRDQDARGELETATAISPDDPDIKVALAQVYERSGEKEKAQALMKGITGAASVKPGADIYAQALRDDMDVSQSLRDAHATLEQIGDQFDSGEYDRLGPSAFSAMNLVALAWARIGWASFLQGETLEGMKYLNASWTLCQCGTVANRLARAFAKEGQQDKARHMFALAVAAGGDEGEASRQALLKLSSSPDSAQQDIDAAQKELLQMRTVTLPSITAKDASAQFNLVFESSTRPERAEYFSGDESLRNATQQLQQKDYPVKFPDVSSVKLIRRGTLACPKSGCTLVLLPPDSIQPPAQSSATAAPGPPR